MQSGAKLALGVAIGVALGIALDNLALWVALGVAIGTALSAASWGKSGKQVEGAGQPDDPPKGEVK
jgi:hypothetical protein